MLDKLKSFYSALPKQRVKFLKYVPDKILFGKSYLFTKKNLSFDLSRFHEGVYQTLLYSRNNTEYGKETLPKDIHSNEAIQILNELPFVSSNDLAKNIEYYSSKEFNKLNSYYATTGGTGRNPTTILLSNESYGIEWAHMHAIWSVSGYKRKKAAKLTLRGNVIKGDKYFDYNPIYNEFVVNTYKMSRENFSVYLNLIDRYKIKYLHGYPSLIKEFYEYCQLHHANVKFKAIFFGSEGISAQEKINISKYFQAIPVSWYGQTEKVILAQDFSATNHFKVFSSYGYPRIINPDENGFGEIVGTTFVNNALPLINYKTGDFGRLINDGKSIYIADIKGRWGKDYVYLNDKKRIPTASINLHSLIQSEILFYQIHQKKYGELLIKILPKKDTKLTKMELISIFTNDMKDKLKDFQVNYLIVENEKEIKRSARGKMIMLVQELISEDNTIK